MTVFDSGFQAIQLRHDHFVMGVDSGVGFLALDIPAALLFGPDFLVMQVALLKQLGTGIDARKSAPQ